MCIFWIGEKRDCTLGAFLNLGKSVYLGVFVAFHSSANDIGYLFCCKFHVFCNLDF